MGPASAHRRFPSVAQPTFEACASLRGTLEHRPWFGGRGELEDERAIVPNFPHAHQSGVPVDPPFERHEMLVASPAIVMHVRRRQVLGDGFDGVRHVAHQEGVPEVEADARAQPLEVPFDHRDERGGVRDRVRDHLERHADANRFGQPADLLDAAEGRGAAVLAPLHRRRAEVHDEDARRDLPRDVQRGVHLPDRRLPLAVVTDPDRDRRPPLVAGRHALDDRRMDAVQREPRFLQPVAELRDRRGVVIVEVRPRGEHLDRFEPVRRDVREVRPAQPLIVEQVRGNAELHGRFRLDRRNLSLYTGAASSPLGPGEGRRDARRHG